MRFTLLGFTLLCAVVAAQPAPQCDNTDFLCTGTARQLSKKTICGSEGTVPATNLLKAPCTSPSLESCRSSCTLNSCISYGYNNVTQECRLFSKRLIDNGFRRKPADGFLYWNFRCFKQDCPSICNSNTPSQAPTCTDFSWRVVGSATHRDLTTYQPTSADCSFNPTQPDIPVGGLKTIAGTYCAPTCYSATNRNRLQILSHGVLSNREYWFGLGYQPANYSWVQYAANRGFHTMAFDRLGAGRSSHPDPSSEVQTPLEIALLHDMVEAIKHDGTDGALPQAFTDLTFVGHNYGSLLGVGLADAFPDDVNALVLTGFSGDIELSCSGFGLMAFSPAAIVDPAEFGTLSPGYLTASIQDNTVETFFGSSDTANYDPALTNLFYGQRDVISRGQYYDLYNYQPTAPEYSGRVLVLNGLADQIACGSGNPSLSTADCSSTSANTAASFVGAASNWANIPEAGNAVNLHSSAQKVFKTAHDFLDGASFPPT